MTLGRLKSIHIACLYATSSYHMIMGMTLFCLLTRRAAQSPFSWQAAQATSSGTADQHHSDNGPGESTPSAAFGWTGLDERTSSGHRPAGRINRWWTTFDAAYMQPVFGGPGRGGGGGGGGPDSDPLLPTRMLPRTEEHDLV